MKVTPPMPGLQRLTHATTALPDAQRADVRDDVETRRWKKMEEALQQLNAMPTPAESAKASAKARIAMLKQRLEELKAMLLHASPAQAKALAAVLKGIGSQLASAAQSVGAASGGQTPVAGVAQLNASVAPAATPATATADVATAHTEVAVSTDTDAPAGAAATETAAAKSNDSDAAKQRQGVVGAKTADDDKSLRDLLREAKKLLKEVANMLRAKLAEHDKEGKADLAAAERSVARIDGVGASGGLAVYTPLGGLDTGAADVAAVGGMTVDTLA